MANDSAASNFPFQCILLIGATAGIGWHLADRLYQEGRKVIIVGRRKERLEEFIRQHDGSGDGNRKKPASYVFDVTQLEKLPEFIEKVTSEHPEIDAIWHNSGIQRGFNFAEPATVDLDNIHKEFTTNYTSAVHLSKAALPFLISKSQSSSSSPSSSSSSATPTALLFTTSCLALIPLGRCPNYCATKAALHHFLMSLRGHMEAERTGVRIIEVLPPAVRTELHDKEFQPDIENGREIGMGVEEFTDEVWRDLVDKTGPGAERDEFPVGEGKYLYEKIEPVRRSVMVNVPLTPANIQKS